MPLSWSALHDAISLESNREARLCGLSKMDHMVVQRGKKMNVEGRKECPTCRSMIHPKAKVCPHCNHKFGASGGKTIVAVVAVLGLLAFCSTEHHSGPAPKDTSSTSADTGSVTAAKYSQIENGMNYREVADIMGSSGEEQVNSNISGINGRIVTWKNWNGSNMMVQFMNDRVIMKSQFGLN